MYPEETYCRLCAEPTAKDRLISTEEDTGINSKISKKMLWINIDMHNTLPNTICFPCFDLLERTWRFLHNVRLAQEKLLKIFKKKPDQDPSSTEMKTDDSKEAGKPVNKNWDDFQETKIWVKYEIPIETDQNLKTNNVDPTTNLNVDVNIIKTERNSDNELDGNDDLEDIDTSDSDLPLGLAVKKKEDKKKTKKKDSIKPVNTEIHLDVAPLTWDNYMCRCANCDTQCKNVDLLRLHSLQEHSCCCKFKCSDCSKVITKFKTFVNHVRLHNKLLRYCCEFCNKRFKRAIYTKNHLNMVHRDSYLTMCTKCGAMFKSLELLNEHMKKDAMRHENIETDLKCEHCSKEFKSRRCLLQHKLLHTERSKNFSCHVCGKMFFTKDRLSRHMMIHNDTKPFKCDICMMAFRERGNLRSHISLHSGAKPFVCDQCGKSFRVKRFLKLHLIVHTDLKPYVCKFCNKAFRSGTRLKVHLRQHTGERPYNCVHCQRDFTHGTNLKKHLKRRHNIDDTRKQNNNIVNE